VYIIGILVRKVSGVAQKTKRVHLSNSTYIMNSETEKVWRVTRIGNGERVAEERVRMYK